MELLDGVNNPRRREAFPTHDDDLFGDGALSLSACVLKLSQHEVLRGELRFFVVKLARLVERAAKYRSEIGAKLLNSIGGQADSPGECLNLAGNFGLYTLNLTFSGCPERFRSPVISRVRSRPNTLTHVGDRFARHGEEI